MGYYTRHSVYLEVFDEYKMNRLDRLLKEREVWLRDNVEDIFRSDGEPLNVRCLSDIGWNSGSGLKWYDFDTDLERVSEEFAKEFPEEEIVVYTKDEYDNETEYRFHDGQMTDQSEIVHYSDILGEICGFLNEMKPENTPPFRKVFMAPSAFSDKPDGPSGWPVVLHNHGAFVNIKYNVFELLHTADGYRYEGVPYDYGCRHFECIPGKIRALQSFFDELIKRRNTL